MAAYNELEAPRDPTAEPPKDITSEQPKDVTVSHSRKMLIYNRITLISLKEANKSLEAREEESLEDLQPIFENIGNFYQYFLFIVL